MQRTTVAYFADVRITRHARLRDKPKQGRSKEARTAGDEPGKTGAIGGGGRERGKRAGGKGSKRLLIVSVY